MVALASAPAVCRPCLLYRPHRVSEPYASYPALRPSFPHSRCSTIDAIEADAAQAALWFTAERFSYLCACQRYYEHQVRVTCEVTLFTTRGDRRMHGPD